MKGWAFIAGGAWTSFQLESECVNDVKYVVGVDSRAFSLDYGLNGVPSGIQGKVEFEDHQLDLSPYVFNGSMSYLAIGPTVGKVSGTLDFHVGKATSTRTEIDVGVDASLIGGGFGNSWVTGVTRKDCGCE